MQYSIEKEILGTREIENLVVYETVKKFTAF